MERSMRFSPLSLFNILRITNMLVIIRLLRIIPSIKVLNFTLFFGGGGVFSSSVVSYLQVVLFDCLEH